MIFHYMVTQTTMALIPRKFNHTHELLHQVDRYSHAMLVERDRRQEFTEEVTDLDYQAITFMTELLEKTQMHSVALANEAYMLALGSMSLAETYQKDWAAKNRINPEWPRE